MRLIIRILILLLSSGHLLGVFAQGTTARSGYAIVTVVSGNIAGVIATESLKNQTSSGTEQDILAPSPLITSASILVTVGSTSEDSTAIAIANPSLGQGSVNLRLTDASGTLVLDSILRLTPRGQISRFLNELFPRLQPGFSSPLLLTLSSEIPVAVVALSFQGADFASIPITSLASPTPVPAQPLVPVSTIPASFNIGLDLGINGSPLVAPVQGIVIGGGNSLVFAEVATGGDWSSQIAIGNTSTGTQTVRVDFFGSDGIRIQSINDTVIPSRGVFFFSTDSSTATTRR